MNKIGLYYGHYPDTEIFIVVPDGITPAQLRHYVKGLGFLDFQNDDGQSLLCGSTSSQKDALHQRLEALGYRLKPSKIFRAVPFDVDEHEGDAS
ncbi:hypothetical protein LH464_22915 [Neorhizobium sp. T786]|uniref:hypothetical protein n=1 Tax=Pseudorhizobium xiangyangii TaxID=2883104 RepID=UPI001CFFCAB0|nr:hypothetical protein [Neorhizobium xiangyangii]MCB5205317.1 hypothetical protein [Neorhizobium xiangyangii]